MNTHRLKTMLALGSVLLCMALAGCAERAPTEPESSAPQSTAQAPAAASPMAAQQVGTLIVTRADGSSAWILRVDGSHVEVTGPDGLRLIGEQRGDKRRYRRESDGAAIAEVKFSDSGFKLRTPDSQLLWKVKYGDDKIKISDNEENQNPWVLKTGYSDKAKVLDPSESEIGDVRFQGQRIKVKDAAGTEQFLADTTQRSAGLGVTQMSGIPEQHRGILMVELLAAGR